MALALGTWLMASLWDWFVEKARAHQQNNSERPANPQPEPFYVIQTKLGDANQNSGNIRGSCNTTITYMDPVAWGKRSWRDNFGRPASFLPIISASVGNHNKGCGNIENSGGTDIYNLSLPCEHPAKRAGGATGTLLGLRDAS